LEKLDSSRLRWREAAIAEGWPSCKKEAAIAAIERADSRAKRTTIRRFLDNLGATLTPQTEEEI